MYEDVIAEGKEAMSRAVDALKREMSKVRTGRASISLLDDVRVDYYGTPTPLNQVGTLAVPEARLITIQPWEKQLIPDIEKAILKSDLGLNPASDGQIIRIAIPALTEERRKEMTKVIRRMGEDSKVAVRNARRDANENLKMLEKEKEIGKDDEHRGHEEMQKLRDHYIGEINTSLETKEKDILIG